MLSIIVATNKSGAIGLNGKMPWTIPEDLKHFQKTTMGHKVVMGRITLEGLKKPLNGREVYCVTRSDSIAFDSGQQVQIINDFEEFLQNYQLSNEKVFIAGGAWVYEYALEYVNELIISFVDIETEADTFFPNFFKYGFQIVNREKVRDFEVITYRRPL